MDPGYRYGGEALFFIGIAARIIPWLIRASREVQEYTDGQLKWVIDNGITPSGMPSARGILSDEEQWAIVVYLRHLPSAGSLGEPAMYGN